MKWKWFNINKSTFLKRSASKCNDQALFLFKKWSRKFLIRRIIVTRNFCLKMSFLGYFQTSLILHSELFLLKLCVEDSPHIQNWCDLHFVASDSFTSIKTSIFNIKIDKFLGLDTKKITFFKCQNHCTNRGKCLKNSNAADISDRFLFLFPLLKHVMLM